jgi:hypothetical protein
MKTLKQHLEEKYWDEGEVVQEWTEQEFVSVLLEAEYQGRKVKLDQPFSGDSKHKRYVYVKNEKGNIIKLGFGDPNMEIRRDNPDARRSFRARHHCDTDPGPKWKARYWSCRFWSSTPVNKLD